MLLGADVGSALVVQVLTDQPHLDRAGAADRRRRLFFRGRSRTQKQLGRVLFGMALIFISLAMIGEATVPLRDSPTLPAVVNYLRGDFLTAFLIGAAFTWLVHSSVASMLLIATLAAQGLDPGRARRFAGAWRQSWRGADPGRADPQQPRSQSRRIAIGHLALRGSGAVIVAAVLFRFAADCRSICSAHRRRGRWSTCICCSTS